MHILIEIEPLDAVDGSRPLIRLCSAEDRKLTGLGGQRWIPGISKKPTLSMRLFDGDFTADVENGSASLELRRDALILAYANARRLRWAGAPVRIKRVDAGYTATDIFAGRVSAHQSAGNQIAVTAETDGGPFQRNVLYLAYGGTGGAEGGADLKGQLKPWALGQFKNAEPVFVDKVNNVHQVSAYGAIGGVTAVYERGASLGASIGDYPDYAALVAASIPNGRWATCNALGMFRTGAPPYGVITCDGGGDTGAASGLTGDIISRLATGAGVSSGLVDAASLAALNSAVPYPINVILSEQDSVIEIAQRLARPCNAQAGVSWLGKLFVARIATGTPALTLHTRGKRQPAVSDSGEQQVSPPYKRIVMGANRSWRVHTLDEIAFAANLIDLGAYNSGTTYREGNIVSLPDQSRWVFVGTTPAVGSLPADVNANWARLTDAVTADDVTYQDGTTVEQLKPAEPGATEGMTPAERQEVEQLAGTVVDLDAAVAAAQSQIAAIEGSIGDIDAPALRDDIAALQTQAASIIGSIGDIGTQVDQVETSVSTLSGSVNSLSQTVTNLNGTVSTLSQTVSTQGGQISTIAQSITTLSGTLSTLNTIVSASSNPNLLPNGGFENGLRGWNNSGSGVVANAWFRATNAAWGSYAVHGAAWTGQASETYGILESDTISGLDVGSLYTVAADADIRPNGQIGAWAAIQIKWITSGSPIYTDIINPVAIPATGIDFSESGSGRAAFKLTRQVPAGTTGLAVRLVTYAPQGVQINSMAWRQVKLERGQIATPYSGEATAGQVFTAYSDLNNSFASLSTTVSAQGATISQNATAISTLQGQQSSLSTTVSTQGAAISTLQTATSTLQGDTATLITKVSSGVQNLLPNGDFANGLSGWVRGGADGWGVADEWSGRRCATIATGAPTLLSPRFAVAAGTLITAGAISHNARVTFPMYMQFRFEDAAGGNVVFGDSVGLTNGGLGRISRTTTVPAGASYCRLWFASGGNDSGYVEINNVTCVIGAFDVPNATPIASVSQAFSTLSTLTSQYASLSSTVSTLNSSVSVQQTAIDNLQGKTAAWWQVQAIAGSDRASAQLFAGGGFAGFDIVGDLRVTGNALIGGTVNPEALALDRFVKRIYGTGSGSPAAGETLLLYAQDIGVTTANGSYQIELAGEMTTTVGRQTSTLGGLPYYINHNADGGLRIVINKNGSTIYQTDIHASEYITANDVGPKVYSLNRNIVVDSPGGGDASGGNATILIYAVRGSADSGAVNQGDYYTRDVSATYSGFNIAAKTKWTFV